MEVEMVDVTMMLTRDRLTFDRILFVEGDNNTLFSFREVGGPHDGREWTIPWAHMQYAFGTRVVKS